MARIGTMKRRYSSHIMAPNSDAPVMAAPSIFALPRPTETMKRMMKAMRTGTPMTSAMKAVPRDQIMRPSDRSKMRSDDDQNDGIAWRRRAAPAAGGALADIGGAAASIECSREL